MSADGPETGVEALCRRYGPGRLPGAGRPAIGAGYAFATAALISMVVWVFLAGGATTVVGVGYSLYEAPFGLVAVVAVVALFFLPGAFLSGALAHVLLPERLRRRGALTGALAMVGTYVVGTPLVGTALWLTRPGEYVLNVQVAVLLGWYAFLLSGWLSLPVGAAVGHVHRRASGGSVKRGVAWRSVRTVRGYAASYLGPPRDRAVDGWARHRPSRLPGGDRPDIAAGYAFAAVAATVTVVYCGSALLLAAFQPPGLAIGVARAVLWLALAVVTVVPVAFAAGALAWARLPDDLPYRGVIAGMATMAAASLFGGSAFGLLVSVLNRVAVAEAVGVGAYALVYIGWLSLPVGAVAGYVHERSVDTTHTF